MKGNVVFSQIISPYTFNNGGGSSSLIEWSLTESVSIASFITPSFSLNTGVLQPMTSIVTSINEYGPMVFGNEISIGPNPTSHFLHIKTHFAEAGNLTFQLIDSKSSIILKYETGLIYNNYENNFSLAEQPSGIFFMKIIFKPIQGNIKTGIYKIIKI